VPVKIAVLTAGGVAPGMNAVVRAVAQTAFSRGWEVVGVEGGFEGILEGRLNPIDRHRLGGLMHRGGTVLGTGRAKEVRETEGQERAALGLEFFVGATILNLILNPTWMAVTTTAVTIAARQLITLSFRSLARGN
jgi:6-phosphofructokinase